jgi:polar amino acid transport system substrate-binding protein
MSARTRSRVVIGLISCAAIALGGCATVSEDAQRRSLAALGTEPVQGKLPKDPDCVERPIRSLPPSVLPRPGHMPDGTFMHDIQGRHLRVGVDQNSLQLGYLNPITAKPRMEGFDIDVVREVARAIFGDPHRIRYTAISTAQRQTAIEEEKVDIVASAYSISCQRLRHMRFSSVYYRAQQRLLVLKSSPISSLHDPDARGKRVCATSGSTTLDRLNALRRETGIVPVAVPLRPDCLVELQEGDVDAISSDDAILLGFQKQDPQTRIVGPSLECERWGMAINKGHSDFVRFVNAVLARMRRRRLAEIRERWLGDLRPSKHGSPCPQPAPRRP